ncbi:hypothetical protein GWI33_023006 [Rhynchophorus ferrugineus]|uniref:Uncharacterized protein n=1 Tax=Rhynchophorus ferrugineus TaxID=354439 RepID=A0A834IMP0_RHYFE|nr:hypothetical protein GWI33_023006 [Rhynchophorus ferrugineus]
MFKFFAVVFAVLAVAFAAPKAEPKPGVALPLAYSAYSAPLAYSAPVVASYSAPSLVHGYAAAPLAYSAYAAPAVVV